MNLYKYNANGKLIKQLTHNKWVTNDVLGFSKKGKYVYIIGTGKDPRNQKLFKVNTRNGKTKVLTKKDGQHYVQLNDLATHYLDNFSNVNTPRIISLNDTKGKTHIQLLKAGNPVKDYNINPKPEMFSITGEYGDKLYARLFKPANFDATKKYPVLVYVYGGPHAQLVTNRWLGGAPLWMPWLASQGYLVFTVDGHGSDNRGFAFESVIHRHLGRVEMKDQLHGVDYLKSLPYVDAQRLAVHGWSFGGFMTSSLMTTYPDVFTTGVAGGPVTDWKWYEVMYGERYMDRYQDNPEGFKETSVLNKIQNLKGHLLTIHGYQDATVVPQHNLALHREAIKKNIQMDFYLYPTAKHNVRGIDRAHLMQKVLNYIMQYNQ
jgi:dipeptidyl-peptidase-4